MGAMDLILPVAQLAASFAPVPGLSPAFGLLDSIIKLCQNVSVNKNLIAQLRDRCTSLLQAVSASCQGDVPPEKLREAIDLVEKTLSAVKVKLIEWGSLSFARAFIEQSNIADDINRLHANISNCSERLQLTSHIRIHQWQEEFDANRARDHREVTDILSQIRNTTNATGADVARMSIEIEALRVSMQNSLSIDNRREPEQRRLRENLYELSQRTGDTLPELNLKRGEVQRIGQYPDSSTTTMDIWEGIYLDREKVAMRAVRATKCDPKTIQRFMREAKIWAEIQKIDRGQHVLPFYGLCFNDGPNPYMISPWQRYGNAITYVQTYDNSVDYRHLFRGIAEGLRVLHTMQPPVVHGDLKGENIYINDVGQPLLANFGLTKAVEDITGVPFTQSCGVAESYRWFAPEVCTDQGCLSMSSDIYAFAMTVLELITHKHPYSRIKHTYEVARRSGQGEIPERPVDGRVIKRGLDDMLWNLLKKCWSLRPRERPDIHEILNSLT